MPLATKEYSIIALSIIIIYLGIYTLRANSVPTESSRDAMWAGVLSVTLGVFSILSLLFNQPGMLEAGADGTAGVNIYLLVSLGAFVTSVFFNYKLVCKLPDGKIKFVIYGQIVAHLTLLVAYFMSSQETDKIKDAVKTAIDTVAVAPESTSRTGDGVLSSQPPLSRTMASPRLTVRGR